MGELEEEEQGCQLSLRAGLCGRSRGKQAEMEASANPRHVELRSSVRTQAAAGTAQIAP